MHWHGPADEPGHMPQHCKYYPRQYHYHHHTGRLTPLALASGHVAVTTQKLAVRAHSPQADHSSYTHMQHLLPATHHLLPSS